MKKTAGKERELDAPWKSKKELPPPPEKHKEEIGKMETILVSRINNGTEVARELLLKNPGLKKVLRLLEESDYEEHETSPEEKNLQTVDSFATILDLSTPQAAELKKQPALIKLIAAHRDILLDSISTEVARADSRKSIKDYLREKFTLEFQQKKQGEQNSLSNFDQNIGNFASFIIRDDTRSRIIGSLPHEEAEKYKEKLSQLAKKRQNGEIKDEEAMKEYDVITTEAVKKSGDVKLQADWLTYQQSEQVYLSTLESHSFARTNEIKIVDKKEIEKYLDQQEIAMVGTNVRIDARGNAKVSFDQDISVDVKVYRTDKGEQVFYITDPYTKDPLRVESSQLLAALDQRHLDAFISKKLAPYDSDNDPVAEIPDNLLIKLVENLIGKGKNRGFSVSENDRAVIAGLARVLGARDKEFPSFKAKIVRLNDYIGSQEKDKKNQVYEKLKAKKSDEKITLTQLFK